VVVASGGRLGSGLGGSRWAMGASASRAVPSSQQAFPFPLPSCTLCQCQYQHRRWGFPVPSIMRNTEGRAGVELGTPSKLRSQLPYCQLPAAAVAAESRASQPVLNAEQPDTRHQTYYLLRTTARSPSCRRRTRPRHPLGLGVQVNWVVLAFLVVRSAW
jgi:hypothetical protein